MTVEAWITLAVVVATVATLVSDRIAPSLAMLAATSFLLVVGVLEPEEALSGFANEAPVTVAALYVLVGAAEATGLLGRISAVFGRGGSEQGDLVRIAGLTTAASAFVVNTPLVVAVAPQAATWARRLGRSPSRYLMPISFAALLGGVITSIGTSTNLTVSGLMREAGQAPIGLFEITAVGLPIALVGVAVMLLTLSRLLPERRGLLEGGDGSGRAFTVEMVVGAPLAGRTVEQAGLRHLQGVFLVEVERNGRTIAPATPETMLEDGDRLTFAGNIDQVVDLQRLRGLRSAEERHFDLGAPPLRQRFFLVVLGEDSPLNGSTLKEIGFRARYGAAVVAIHRAGRRVPAKLGEVPLRSGDVLLVLTDSGFGQRWRHQRDFLIVSPIPGAAPTRSSRSALAGVLFLGTVLLAGTGLLPLLHASLVAALGVVGLRILTPNEARGAVDLNIVILIAASFGVGAAVQSSGLADVIAAGLLGGLSWFGDLGLLAGVFLATVVLTALISNNAAAVLVFPIALSAAQAAGLSPRPFAIAIAVAASTDFLTPVGYQTNAIIYGMGGYRFADFARVGTPLTLVSLVLSLLIIPAVWPLR